MINVTSPVTYSQPQTDKTTSPTFSVSTQLNAEEKQQLKELQTRDRIVRAHEAAHIASGGKLIQGPANFNYQKGPDGQQYAVGGDVSIDTSKVENDPEATLDKAQQIRAAALAPSQPSAQDRSVAAQAAQMAVKARAEISQQNNTSNVSMMTDRQVSESPLNLDFTV